MSVADRYGWIYVGSAAPVLKACGKKHITGRDIKSRLREEMVVSKASPNAQLYGQCFECESRLTKCRMKQKFRVSLIGTSLLHYTLGLKTFLCLLILSLISRTQLSFRSYKNIGDILITLDFPCTGNFFSNTSSNPAINGNTSCFSKI